LEQTQLEKSELQNSLLWNQNNFSEVLQSFIKNLLGNWLSDISFFRQQKARRDRKTCKKETRIQSCLDRFEKLPGRDRMQLNRQKRNTARLDRN